MAGYVYRGTGLAGRDVVDTLRNSSTTPKAILELLETARFRNKASDNPQCGSTLKAVIHAAYGEEIDNACRRAIKRTLLGRNRGVSGMTVDQIDLTDEQRDIYSLWI